MAKKRSWAEKLNNSKGLPKVVRIEGKMTAKWGEGTMVIPSPKEVDGLMRKVPKGKVTTINEIRRAIAKKHKTAIACPITSGIFAWVSAWAADDERRAGKKDITCWWRTLKGEGELNEKFPGGLQNQKRLLEREGHKIVQKGKKYLVID